MNKKMSCRMGTLGAICVLACSAALAQTTPAAAPPETAAESDRAHVVVTPGDARQGTFKTVQGEVTVVRGNARSAAVVGGGVLTTDRIVTGPNSAAALTLKDGTMLSLGPDSAIDLAQFQFDPTTHDGNLAISMMRGTLRVVTGLIAKLRPERVTVTTPTSVIGVRGTDFIVEENP